jgi:hypothetical protein
MSKLVDSILDLAQKIVPLIVPGAAGAIETVKAVGDLFEHAKTVVTAPDATRLEEGREAFEKHVAATVGDAVNVLRG